MSELNQKRNEFVETLHEVFLMKKGYGAFAYISLNDAMLLFDQHVESNEPPEAFIHRFVKSF